MNEIQVLADHGESGLKQGHQYLTFLLDGEEYAIDILGVKEIRGWSRPTPMPHTPEYVKGVINLRGTIVPIVDLRIRFGLEPREYGPSTVVVVLRLAGTDSDRGELGLVVDAVSEVYTLDAESIKPAPDLAGAVEEQFVNGLATIEEKLLIVLDSSRLVSHSMLGEIQRSADVHSIESGRAQSS
jgi:purine-binding chemotaxis protein CheW